MADYYKTLGVAKTASAEEIRKAHRKLSREYHPDVKPDDESAAQKFKEIQEAYDVLSDEEKRAQYDQFGENFRHAGRGPGGQTYQWNTGAGGAGPIDIEQIFGGQFGGFEDLFGGGRGRGFRGAPQQPQPVKGQNIKTEIAVPFHVAVNGGEHDLRLQVDGKTESLSIKIPAGVNNGSVIRLSGQGQPGFNGGAAGDLLLTINVAPHPWFRREGNNLLVDVPITPSEAALGAKIDVPTLSEGNIVLTIPAGTSTGTKLRLKGQGVVNQKTSDKGDQFVVVKIVLPDSLTSDEKNLYEQLQKIQSGDPREGLW